MTANGGGKSGAGIGGGGAGNGANITVSGGTVTATGGNGGAGIGGGTSGNGKNITVSGGTVTANGGDGGAGIGGGRGYGSYSTDITISGGRVTANGGDGGAGIGGGLLCNGTNITISGGTVTAATDGGGGAGIGGGERGNGTNITISGGTVTVDGGSDAGIGGGDYGKASDNKISPQNGRGFIVTGDISLTKQTTETDISGWMEHCYTITFDLVTVSYAVPVTGNAGAAYISISSGSITTTDRLVVSDNKAKPVSGNTQGLGYNTSAVSIVSASDGTTVTLADFAARNADSVVFAGDISLASGTNTFANGALLSFNVGTENANQSFTMIHFSSTGLQTAVGIADSDSVVSYTVNTLSPFILLKGEYTVTELEPGTISDTPIPPQTGDDRNTVILTALLLLSASAFVATAVYFRKKKEQESF